MQWKTGRKLVLFSVLVLSPAVLALLAMGCARPSDSQPEKMVLPFDGQIVKVTCPRSYLAVLMNRHGSLWAKTTGARVEGVACQEPADLDSIGDASVWLI